MREFLVETALLTHGLPSITDEELLAAWESPEQNIAWIEQGEAKIGNMEQFLAFRRKSNNLRRIDRERFETACSQGISGALTASGTMALCQKLGIKLAVTCGMGGIGAVKAERLCPDLPALAQVPVVLISTGPKDMLDIPATLDWLNAHSVTVCCVNENHYTGYLFKSANVAVTQANVMDIKLSQSKGLLLLNPIPEEKRILDYGILKAGIVAGEQAELQGQYYHPAANAAFDKLTEGYSSKIQLESLMNNVKLAKNLVASLK